MSSALVLPVANIDLHEEPRTSSTLSFASFSSFEESEDVDGSMRVKNTFIHVDRKSYDFDDDFTLPRKSLSAPIIETHSLPCDFPAVTEISSEETEVLMKAEVTRTPKVTFDLSPCFFPGEDMSWDRIQEESPFCLESKGSPLLAHMEGTSLYEIKNTFIHIDKSLVEDSDIELPTRSVSVPSMPASDFSPVASPVKVSLASLSSCMSPVANVSSFHVAAEPAKVVPSSAEASQLPGPPHLPVGLKPSTAVAGASPVPGFGKRRAANGVQKVATATSVQKASFVAARKRDIQK